MVCIDSSIFISLFRDASGKQFELAREVIQTGQACITGQIWIEVIGGYKSTARREVFVQQMREYPWLDTTREAYELAADWVARYKGIGPGDAIIAATTYLNKVQLLTIDKGFSVLKREGLLIFPR